MSNPSGPRVLLIEDEMMVARGMEMTLADAGYDVVGPMGNFDRAREAAASEAIDLAVLDINLRGREVFPIADILSARGIRFAFLTGYGREVLPERYADSPLLLKPFRPEQLLAIVAELAPV